MAKPKIPNQKNKYNQLNKRLSSYVALVRQIYDLMNLEAAKMAERVGYSGEKPFKFSDYPQLKDGVNRLKKSFVTDLKAVIYTGTSQEWKESNLVQDLVADKVLKSYGAKVGGKKYKIYYQTNSDALKAFQERKDKGMTISQKLWNQSTNYKEELEYAISSAIQKGTSAVTLSKRISKYLQDFGKLQKDYKVKYGKAVTCNDCEYRSIRLARSEINMAYRTAEQTRWQQMDFVVGYEIKLSHSHHHTMPHGDICDELAGKYPKDFKWTGWHPNDMCYVVPILKTEDEFWADNDVTSKNEVTDTPQQFKDWVSENKDRIQKAKGKGTLPYFVKDNPSYTRVKKTPQEIAVERHAKRDESAIRQAARNRYLLDVADVDNRMIAGLRRNAKMYGVDIDEFNDYIYSHKFKESYDLITTSENIALESMYDKYKEKIFRKVDKFEYEKDNLVKYVSEHYQYGNFASEAKAKINSIKITKDKSYDKAISELSDLKKSLEAQYNLFDNNPIKLSATFKEFAEIDFDVFDNDLDKYQESMTLLSRLYGSKYTSTWLYKQIDKELNKSKDFGKAFSLFKEAYDKDVKDILYSINKLDEIKNADLSKINKDWLSKFNDYVAQINSHDIKNEGYEKIYRQIEGAYNILKLSTDSRCIKYGLSKLSYNTPYILIDEYSKIFSNPFSIIGKKEFYDGFETFVPATIRHQVGTAYYSPTYNHVRFYINNRIKNSRVYAEQIQYHEYGHAMDTNQGNWRNNKEWNNLFDKYAKSFNKDISYYSDGTVQYGAKLKDKYLEEYINSNQSNDIEELAGSLSDIFVAFDNTHEKFGHGWHDLEYFKDKSLCLAEFIAHASEIYWQKNPIFAKVHPKLYKELRNLYKQYFEKYKSKH